MSSPQEDCARDLLEVVPLVTRSIRTELRQHRTQELSVPQFRTLLFLRHKPGTSLIDIANHLGLTPPSTSKMVDGLVSRDLLTRHICENDRRRIAIKLTEKGDKSLDFAIEATIQSLTKRISTFSPERIETLSCALQILREAFPETEIPICNKPLQKLL